MNASVAATQLPTHAVSQSEPKLWRMLFWKEWCEHRWKLAALVLVNFSLIVLTAPRNMQGMAESAMVLLYILAVPGAIFIALGTAAGERSRTTLPFLRATPIRMPALAATKLLAGALTAIVPPLVGVWALAGFESLYQLFDASFHLRIGAMPLPFGLEGFYLAHSALMVTISLSAYLWTAALGVNAVSEIRAATIALITGAVWVFLLVWGEWFARGDAVAHLPGWLTTLRAIGPLGFLLFHWGHWTNWLWIPIGLAVTSHLALAARFITAFGNVREGRVSKTNSVKTKPAYLAPPRATPLTAIAWKQWRESAPIALAAFGGVILVSAVLGLIANVQQGYSGLGMAIWFAFAMLLFFGFMATVVIGLGVLFGEVQPGIENFWRSRPIRPSFWFWTKYLTGLATIALIFGLPLYLLGGYVRQFQPSEIPSGFLVLVLAVGFAGYSLSVAWMAVTRHVVYAAILAFGSTLSCIAWADVAAPTTMALSAVVAGACATLIAWLFVAKDWGWRGE